MKHVKNRFIIKDQAFFWVTPCVFFLGIFIAAKMGAVVATSTPNGLGIGHTPVFTAIVLWISLYAYWGFRIIPNKGYLVIERFGEFNRIVHTGPRILCFPGLIDKIIATGTLRNQELELFKDETPVYRVDFTDGSAPVECKVWFRIGGNAEKISEIDENIYKFTYSLKDEKSVRERIEDVLESIFVPRLQELSIQEALTKKDVIADDSSKEPSVKDSLSAVGIFLCTPKGFVITDIILSEDIVKLRQEKLKGGAEADKQTAQGLGYARTINAIIKELGVTAKEAREIYETQRGLETIEKLRANVQFIAPSIKDIQKTIGVNQGQRGTEEKETPQ